MIDRLKVYIDSYVSYSKSCLFSLYFTIRGAECLNLYFFSFFFFQTEPCNFDELNKQSPCHFPTCYEDAESAECIRYILDYCNQWEDRGCVIELPQLLNKVDEHRMEEITTMKSPYQ